MWASLSARVLCSPFSRALLDYLCSGTPGLTHDLRQASYETVRTALELRLDFVMARWATLQPLQARQALPLPASRYDYQLYQL